MYQLFAGVGITNLLNVVKCDYKFQKNRFQIPKSENKPSNVSAHTVTHRSDPPTYDSDIGFIINNPSATLYFEKPNLQLFKMGFH